MTSRLLCILSHKSASSGQRDLSENQHHRMTPTQAYMYLPVRKSGASTVAQAPGGQVILSNVSSMEEMGISSTAFSA